MRLLVVVATDQERAALLRSLPAEPAQVGPYRAARTAVADVLVSGVGPAAAAACAGAALALESYDLAASVGIAGAFRGTAEVGDIVVATEIVAADLGADSPDGFLGLDVLGWTEGTHVVEPDLLEQLVAAVGEVVTGPVLTVSTVTGTRIRADELARRHGAVAEAMEGWGVVEAGRVARVPVVEVRTVSNLVSDRDVEHWNFPRALASLEQVGPALLGSPWA
jgi:futalosine hydrolase